MTNRRGLLQTFCAAGTVGIAGCGGPVRGVLGGDPPVVEPCKDGTWTWPTAGGDPGRTGWTDTAPPAADAAVVDLLGSVRENGRQRLASSAPVVADGKAYVSSGSEVVVLDPATGETRWSVDTGMVTGRPVVGEGWVALGRTNSGVSVYDRTTGEMRNGWSREDYDLGTVDAVVPVDEGFVIREGTTSGLSLIR